MTSFGSLTKPNILLIMTDEQTSVPLFPAAWTSTNLPSFAQLQNTGFTFTNAITNTSPCSPSRATLFTGLYPAKTGVFKVGETLPSTSSLATLATVLASAGYEVAYKGKWHLSSAFDEASASASAPTRMSASTTDAEDITMLNTWGFHGWTAPDAGTSLKDMYTLGGGVGANDRRIVTGPLVSTNQETAVSFLAARQGSTRPFCLIVSFVNPHDIFVYPAKLSESGYTDTSYLKYTGFSTQESYSTDNLSTKPTAQQGFLKYWATSQQWQSTYMVGNKLDPTEALNYLQFYAYLQQQVDLQIVAVLNALGSLAKNTIVVRLADHGEMAMAHGGLIQKDYNVYQETIGIPMIFSNPTLWPTAKTSPAMAGTIDILPTLATIAGVDAATVSNYNPQGTDLTPILLGTSTSVQTQQLFTFDDNSASLPNGHIRCLKTEYGGTVYKYAVYCTISSSASDVTSAGNVFSGQPEYELYDLNADPNEMTNLLYGATSVSALWSTLHTQLTTLMSQMSATPTNWPTSPMLASTT
jgi:choline-sulfatase